MVLFDLMHPEVWRRVITEKFTAETKFLDTLPIEKYKAKDIHYFVQKTLADTPEIFSWGGGVPYALGTYEKKTASLELYGIGVEVPRIDVDLLPFGWNVLRREIEQKSAGMARYLDRRISDLIVAEAGNSISATAAQWTTAGNIQPDVAEAIRLLEEDNIPIEDMCMVLSPRAHELMLNSLVTTAQTIAPPGQIQRGRVVEYLGITDIRVSNNLSTADTVLIFRKNGYGWLAQAYPLTTEGPNYVEEFMVWRARMYAMDKPVVDQPNAICKITDVY